jgi:hypothetical protein
MLTTIYSLDKQKSVGHVAVQKNLHFIAPPKETAFVPLK